MGKEFFNQRLFMRYVDSLVEKRKAAKTLTKDALMGALDTAPSTYSKWLQGNQEMTATDVLRICKFFDIRIEWAYLQTGPIHGSTSVELDEIKNSLASLSDDVRHVVERGQYVPSPVLMSEVRVVGKELGRVLSRLEEELPEQVLLALESVSTLLHQISAPQVAICRNVQLPEDFEQGKDDAPNVE